MSFVHMVIGGLVVLVVEGLAVLLLTELFGGED